MVWGQMNWIQGVLFGLKPCITAVVIEVWRANELQRVKKLLAKGESVDQALEALAKGLTQKMLHGAMAQLNASDPNAREKAKEAVEQFFLRDAHSR